MKNPRTNRATPKKKPTAKQRVLKLCPHAVCRYSGLYGWYVENLLAKLSIGFGSSGAAWRAAAQEIGV